MDVSERIPVRHVDANAVGRDFVIGDLHGHKLLLDDLLTQVKFNMVTDRLFSVGDLADRGQDSLGCLNLLHEEWFFSVQGNHEVYLLDYIEAILSNEEIGKYNPLLINEGDWVLEHISQEGKISQELSNIIELVKRLPLVISVGYGEERFNVAHAELYAREMKDDVYSDDDIDSSFVNLTEYGRKLAYSRLIAGRELSTMLRVKKVAPSLSRTYVGHSIGETIRQSLSHIFIDRGAYLSQSVNYRLADKHCLTMVEPATGEEWCTK